MGKQINLDEDILYQKYILEEKSIDIISHELGCSAPTIHLNLKKYNLCRNKSEAQKLKCNKVGVHNQFELDINLLKKLYLDDKVTTYNVAEQMGCSQYKVWKTLKSLGLTRSVSNVLKGRVGSNNGKKLSEDTKIKISESLKGREGYWFGKERSEEDRRKMRLSAIKRISNSVFNGGQVSPNYNRKSISVIENYGKLNDLSFLHAENGGEYYIEELGYWVDGYDKDKNIVLEFDEKYHNKQIERDNKRQNEIISYLKCGFIRLNESGDEIFKLNNNE